MRRYRFLHALKVAVFACVAAAALSGLVMVLWNNLMPAIFGLRVVSFWQALGLLLLSKLLLGGLRTPFKGGAHWRRRMRERWEHMTPDEREHFKQGLRRGCGRWHETESPNREAEARA